MKRISLAAGIVLLAFLAAVAVGNQSAGGTDKPPVVEWKAVTYTSPTVAFSVTPVAQIVFTAPEAGFVWVNSTGFCSINNNPVTSLPIIGIGWRTSPVSSGQRVLPGSPGDAVFNNISVPGLGVAELPYGASAVFPVLAGTQPLFLIYEAGGPLGGPGTCSGVNVVMFTNTQLLP